MIVPVFKVVIGMRLSSRKLPLSLSPCSDSGLRKASCNIHEASIPSQGHDSCFPSPTLDPRSDIISELRTTLHFPRSPSALPTRTCINVTVPPRRTISHSVELRFASRSFARSFVLGPLARFHTSRSVFQTQLRRCRAQT